MQKQSLGDYLLSEYPKDVESDRGYDFADELLHFPAEEGHNSYGSNISMESFSSFSSSSYTSSANTSPEFAGLEKPAGASADFDDFVDSDFFFMDTQETAERGQELLACSVASTVKPSADDDTAYDPSFERFLAEPEISWKNTLVAEASLFADTVAASAPLPAKQSHHLALGYASSSSCPSNIQQWPPLFTDPPRSSLPSDRWCDTTINDITPVLPANLCDLPSHIFTDNDITVDLMSSLKSIAGAAFPNRPTKKDRAISGKRPGRRGPLEVDSRKHAAVMRGAGNCLNCRSRKCKCDVGVPCRPCVTFYKVGLLDKPCRGFNLTFLSNPLIIGKDQDQHLPTYNH